MKNTSQEGVFIYGMVIHGNIKTDNVLLLKCLKNTKDKLKTVNVYIPRSIIKQALHFSTDTYPYQKYIVPRWFAETKAGGLRYEEC